MEHPPFNPTPEQRKNLLRLAAHLDLGVTNLRFSMERYSDTETPHECGTVACAVGHGPSLGIAPLPGENWYRYTARAFTANNDAWIWMFAGGWANRDNNPRGAAARIYYALKNGIPRNFRAQSMGLAPLSYTVPDRVDLPMVKAEVSA